MQAVAPTFLSPVHCLWDAGATLGEGVLWSPSQQCLYWLDILDKTLHRFDPADGARRSWRFTEGIAAIAECRGQPGLIAAFERGFAFLDPDETSEAVQAAAPPYLHRPEPERTGNRLNDGACDSQGRLWAGSMDAAGQSPTGALYRFEVGSGSVRVDDGFAIVNGPTWSADERMLFVSDTAQARVVAYDFDVESGAIGDKRPWLRLAPGDGQPDGITTDAAGRLWIAHYGAGCVTCHDPVSAVELARVTLPTSHVTNCAFGGPHLRTLYVTTATDGLTAGQLADQPLAGGLFAVEVDAEGLPARTFAAEGAGSAIR